MSLLVLGFFFLLDCLIGGQAFWDGGFGTARPLGTSPASSFPLLWFMDEGVVACAVAMLVASRELEAPTIQPDHLQTH